MDKLFTQSSIKDYLNCNYKYKLKHIEGIYWFQDEFQNNFDLGTDFHTIAERYFLKLNNNYIENSLISQWLSELSRKFPLSEEKKYLPEFDIRYNELELKLMARYDLIILTKDKIEIIDWKTNKKIIKNKDKDIQTKVYMFLLANSLELFPKYNYSLSDISMTYWQPNFPENKVTIKYTFEKHLEFKEYFSKLFEDIKKSSFDRNLNHCHICEFNTFCKEGKD